MMFSYVAFQGDVRIASLCCENWKTPECYVLHKSFNTFQGQRPHSLPHDTVVPFVLMFGFRFWFRVLHWLMLGFDKGPVSQTTGFQMDALLSPGFNLSVCWYLLAPRWLSWCFIGEKWFLLLLLWAGRVLRSDWVFPPSLPRGRHLSQSHSVPEVGVVEVRSYMTTPINLVISDTTVGCNCLILQIFSPTSCPHTVSFFNGTKTKKEV